MSGIILAGPRVYYAMAEDGLLFKWMGAVHPRYRTPYVAIAMQAIWSSVLVLTGTYGVIVSRVIYTEWIFFAALALGHDGAAPSAAAYAPAFRAWGFPVVPIALRARLPRHRPQSDRDRSAREPDRPRARCRRPAGLLRLETHRCP